MSTPSLPIIILPTKKMATPPQQRYLKDLLKEEQEPFHHHHHTPSLNSPSTIPSRRSPLFSHSANNVTPDARVLHLPPQTAALLLAAALRVNKHSNPPSNGSKPRFRFRFRFRYSGLGSLGSLIKRLTNRTPTRKPQTGDVDDGVVRWAASADASLTTTTRCTENVSQEELGQEAGEAIVFANGFERENTSKNGVIGDGDFSFCLNPSPKQWSPALSSPSISPSLPNSQEQVNYENPPVKSLLQEDEEDKDQNNSPVSILDPPFEDDEYENGEEEEDECCGEKDGFDLECSYVFLQRARRRALLKLQTFEELADLDTTKLEGRMEEEEQEDGDEDEHDLESESRYSDDFSLTTKHEFEISKDGFLACESGLMKDLTKPWMKRLVSDTISEEEKLCSSSSGDDDYDQLLVKRVCNRLDSWPEVASNTIEMMVGMDIQEESVKWTKQEQDDEIYRAATEIEFCIIEVLVEELLDEFVSASTLISHHEIELQELNKRGGFPLIH